MKDKTGTEEDDRIVTVTVGALMTFEKAVRAYANAQLVKWRAADELEVARVALDQAAKNEVAAHEADVAATRMLYDNSIEVKP